MASPDATADGQVKDESMEGFVLLGLATLITMIRTYSRWDLVGFRRFQADDFIVWFALVSVALFNLVASPLSLLGE